MSDYHHYTRKCDGMCDTCDCPESVRLLDGSEPQLETVATDSDLLKIVERLEKRYGVSFLGSEKSLLHFARDWVFLTTP